MSFQDKLKHRVRRLRSMRRDELFDRLRQQATARIDGLKAHFGREVITAPVLNVVGEKPQFFFSAESIPRICSALQQRLPAVAGQIVARAKTICEHRFDLLGYEGLYYGEVIDWHLDRVHNKRAPRKPWHKIGYLNFSEVGDSKVTWELNRHQHFVTLAKAYRLTGQEEFAAEIFKQWKHWHAENPYPIGVNWASSLEVAFRSLAWIWTYHLLEGSTALPPGFRTEWLRAQAVNGRHIETYLSTYFSPNTHLLGEAVALFFIGQLCPELPHAQRWKQRGWEVTLQQAERQVQADGVHFEQSTYYHVYALDFFLHAGLLASINGTAVPPSFDNALQKMMDVLCVYGRAGAPPRFGDDDGGRLFDPARNKAEHLLDPLATGAVLFGRGDYQQIAGDIREETLWLVGEAGLAEFDKLAAHPPKQGSLALQASGIYVLEGSRGQQMTVDGGPQGAMTAGHGHADALSITLTSSGQSLLIDPGTCEYVGGGMDRDLFRGTSFHNTLVIDGADQSRPDGPFTWQSLATARPRAWITGEQFDLFIGGHDGYRHLESPVTHERWVFSLKGRFYLIRDLALGGGEHSLDLYWHLHPALWQRATREGVFFDRTGRSGLRFMAVEESGWTRDVRRGLWSSAYGRKESMPVLHFGTVATLPAEFVSLLVPLSAPTQGTDHFKGISVAGQGAAGYRYEAESAEHVMFFGSTKAWSLSGCSTDAEFLYWGHDAKNKTRSLILCNGSFLEIGGKKAIAAERTFLRCELILKDNQMQTFSSGEEIAVDEASVRAFSPEAEPALAGSDSKQSGN